MKQSCFEGCQFGSIGNCGMKAQGMACPYGYRFPAKKVEDEDPALGEISSTDRCPTREGSF